MAHIFHKGHHCEVEAKKNSLSKNKLAAEEIQCTIMNSLLLCFKPDDEKMTNSMAHKKSLLE